MEKQVTTFGKTMVKNIVNGIGIGCTIFTAISFVSSLLAILRLETELHLML